MTAINSINEQIAYKRSHVLIGNVGYVNLMMAKKSPDNIERKHIALKTYFDVLTGYVYNKNLNKSIADIFNKVYEMLKCLKMNLSLLISNFLKLSLLESIEFGHYSKWSEKILTFAAELFEDKNKVLPKLEDKSDNYYVKYKPALGPLLVGMCTSILIFLIELFFQ